MVEHRQTGKRYTESTALEFSVRSRLLWSWSKHDQAFDPGITQRRQTPGLCLAELRRRRVSDLMSCPIRYRCSLSALFDAGRPLGGRHAAVIPALPEEYDASLPLGAYYPHKSENANSNLPRGISYYPQHIIAQAEAQKAQKAAVVQQANGQGIPGPSEPPLGPVLAGPSGLQQPHTIGQQTIADDSGLTIKEYQQPQTVSAPPADTPSQKRATRASTANTNATNTRHTRSVSRGNQLQQTQQPSGPASTVDADGATPMTFAGIMSAFPVPNSAPTPPVIAQNTTGTAS